MTCEASICSPAAEGVCSQTSFSGTNRSLPLNGMPTVAKSCGSEPQKDGFPPCECTKEMFGCSIHPNTRGEWIASMQASLVRILAQQEIELVLAKAQEAAFIEKCSALLASYDPDTCSWKMSARSFLPDLDVYSETWPRSGMTVGGRAYQHQQPVPRTTVIDGGALANVPTPRASANENRVTPSQMNGTHGMSLCARANMWPTPRANDALKSGAIDAENPRNGLAGAVRRWPTPTAGMAKGASPGAMTRRNGKSRQNDRLDYAIWKAEGGGQLNPMFVEWLMGWPLGWTGLKLWVTALSRSRRRLPGSSLGVRK